MNLWAGLIGPMTISVGGSSEHGTGLLVTENYRVSGKFLCAWGKYNLCCSGSHNKYGVLMLDPTSTSMTYRSCMPRRALYE